MAVPVLHATIHANAHDASPDAAMSSGAAQCVRGPGELTNLCSHSAEALQPPVFAAA